MSFKFNFNATQLEASIMNLATKASKSAAAEMRKTAIKVRDLAREYAPYKTGALEDAINYGTTTDSNRRRVFTVYVDVDSVTPKGRFVGDYAWIMEQQLHPFGRQSGPIRYDLDTGSLLKNMVSQKVGGRFLERAMKDGMADMVTDMAKAASRVLSNTRLINADYKRTTQSGEEQ